MDNLDDIIDERREPTSIKLRPSVKAVSRRIAKRKNYYLGAYLETLMIADGQAEGEITPPLPRKRKSKHSR